MLTVTNLASGSFDPWYDKFNYALNTTQCPDGTLCPFANNQDCCDTGQGVKEIHYDYPSSAVMPTAIIELASFYAAAGYYFSTSIPYTSTYPDVIDPTTFYSATDGTSPTPMPSISTPSDVTELITFYVSTSYASSTIIPSKSISPNVSKLTKFYVSTGYALSTKITSMSAPPTGALTLY